MIILSLRLSKGSEMDPYLYYCGHRESELSHTRGLRGGLRKRLYALPGGSAGSGHLQLILG